MTENYVKAAEKLLEKIVHYKNNLHLHLEIRLPSTSILDTPCQQFREKFPEIYEKAVNETEEELNYILSGYQISWAVYHAFHQSDEQKKSQPPGLQGRRKANMNKIINGKRYSTDSAAKLAEWHNGHQYGDFNRVDEDLYRTKSGNYFLHGYGGAQSKYRQQIEQNSWSGGEQIIPMTLEEAQEWAEGKLTGDEYEAIFGAVDDAEIIDESEQIKISLPCAILGELRERREATGATVSWLIIKALRDAGYGKEGE